MKLKKLFAGILAVAMMATMAAPAFATGAETTPNVNSDEKAFNETGAQSVAVTKVLDVEKGTAPDGMKFEFKIYKEGDSTDVLATQSVEFKTTDQNIKAFDTTSGKNGTGIYTRDFTINIPALLGENAKVGTYSYVIEEQDYTYPSVNPAWDKIYMEVTKANSTAEDGSYLYYVALHKGSKSGPKVPATEAFKNVYGKDPTSTDEKENVHSMTLSKTVHGNFGDLGQSFTFKIKFLKADSLTDATGKYAGPQVSFEVEGASIEGVRNGDYLTVGQEYTVTLGHKESITFNNLPDDIKYEITECGDNNSAVNADGNVTVANIPYEVTVNNDMNNKENAAKVTGTVNKTVSADATEAFHNTNHGTPDTGVILDNAPYIALMVIVVAGAAVMVIKKRRHYED